MNKKAIHNKFGVSEKRAPFTTPEGYFEHFADDLLAEIDQLDATPEPKLAKVKLLQPWVKRLIGVAAIILVAIIPYQLIQQKSNRSNLDEIYANLEYYEFFTEQQLYDVVNDDESNEMLDELSIEEALISSVTDFELYHEIN